MDAICLRARGGPEALRREKLPAPRPDAGEVLVRVRAAAVTPTELLWEPTWTARSGEPRAFPVVPGHEFSGVIEAVGPDVSDFAAGDEIYGMNDWFGDGAQAEFCVARAIDVARKPASIDHVSAAATPISALTAWQGLFERASLAAGERVLVHGAAGGVGLFAVQLARSKGAHVIATASAHNLDFARELGAHEAIDYRAERFEDVVGPTIEVVFDAVGDDTLARSWSVLGPRGRLVTVATSAESATEPRVKDAFFIVEPRRDELERIAAKIDAGELRVVVGAVFPFLDAIAAYRHKPRHGKVVLEIPG
jgi:NADPH:quinone reductase-like Zn-dependent oxidoreductase